MRPDLTRVFISAQSFHSLYALENTGTKTNRIAIRKKTSATVGIQSSPIRRFHRASDQMFREYADGRLSMIAHTPGLSRPLDMSTFMYSDRLDPAQAACLNCLHL